MSIIYILNMVDYSWSSLLKFSIKEDFEKALIEIGSIQSRIYSELKCEKYESEPLQK